MTIEQAHPAVHRITAPFDTTGTVFLYLLKRERIALAPLVELLYEIPQLRLRRTDMSPLAGPTLLAHIEGVRAGTYPE